MITPATCRAARGLLDMSQADLATAASVGLSTVRSFEKGGTPIVNNLRAIQTALESAGVEFIADSAASAPSGAGVRLRSRSD